MKTEMSASPCANLQFEIQRRMVEVHNPVEPLPLENSILFPPLVEKELQQLKLQLKCTLKQATETQRWSRDVALFFL
jgi:hypothetical protein